MSKLTLLVMAAGMGSRYGGLKQIDPMGPSGETLLDYAVYDALRTGFDRLVFIIRRDFEELFKRQIGEKFTTRVAVDYVFQELHELPPGTGAEPSVRQKPWGTTHAIWSARNVLKGPFVAVNADDFYGRDAYQRVGDYLLAHSSPSKAKFAMAGYRLDKTLSEFGSVARGVCLVDKENRLLEVDEMTKIQRIDGVIANRDPARGQTVLTGAEPVSMNFWGFTPALFPLIEERLIAFLKSNGKDPKAESYIPSVVSELVSNNQAEVAVLPTNGRWFGVTYTEDKSKVQAALKELVAQGEYPEMLWA